jgi:hypothetical protein
MTAFATGDTWRRGCPHPRGSTYDEFVKALIVMLTVSLVFGCSRKSGEKSATVGLIAEVASEVRDKPRVQLLIKIPREQPIDEDLAMLRTIEETIDREGIGRLTSSGNQPGHVFVIVEAENSAEAISRLRKLVLEAGLLQRSSFRVLSSGA